MIRQKAHHFKNKKYAVRTEKVHMTLEIREPAVGVGLNCNTFPFSTEQHESHFRDAKKESSIPFI